MTFVRECRRSHSAIGRGRLPDRGHTQTRDLSLVPHSGAIRYECGSLQPGARQDDGITSGRGEPDPEAFDEDGAGRRAGVRGPCSLAQELDDVGGELGVVLVQEAMRGVRVDLQP